MRQREFRIVNRIPIARTIAGAVLLGLVASWSGAVTLPQPHTHSHAGHAVRDSLADVRFQTAPGGPYNGGRAIAYRPGDGSEVHHSNGGHGELYRTGSIAGEPTFGFGADGTIFYQLWTLEGFGPVTRSRDGGHSWEVLDSGINAQEFRSNDPFLHIDQDTGRIFTAHYMLRTALCHGISFSDDGGEQWTSSQMCGQTDHQSLFTGPPATSTTQGYPNVVYYCAANGGSSQFTSNTTCFKSLDGGLTFALAGEPAYLGFDPTKDRGQFGIPGFCGALSGHGAAGPDGTIYLPRTYCGQPYLAISRDEGATWERIQVADNGTPINENGDLEHDAGVAIDAEGTLYYTWMGRDRLPYLATSSDGGVTWSEPMMVGAPGVTETSTPGAIVVGSPGRVAIAYLGSENSPGPPFPETEDCKPEPVHCVEEGLENNGLPGDEPESYRDVTWNGYITTILKATGPNPVAFSAAVNDPSEPLIRGMCDPHRCKATFEFIDIAIGPNGRAWATFVDGCADGDCHDLIGEGVLGRFVGGPTLK